MNDPQSRIPQVRRAISNLQAQARSIQYLMQSHQSDLQNLIRKHFPAGTLVQYTNTNGTSEGMIIDNTDELTLLKVQHGFLHLDTALPEDTRPLTGPDVRRAALSLMQAYWERRTDHPEAIGEHISSLYIHTPLGAEFLTPDMGYAQGLFTLQALHGTLLMHAVQYAFGDDPPHQHPRFMAVPAGTQSEAMLMCQLRLWDLAVTPEQHEHIRTQFTVLSVQVMHSACPDCHGTGMPLTDPLTGRCLACHGSGMQPETYPPTPLEDPHA